MATKNKVWDEDDVEKVLVNPIYTGLGPFPRLIEDELWIKAAARNIKQMGAEKFFRAMLRELRTSLESTIITEGGDGS